MGRARNQLRDRHPQRHLGRFGQRCPHGGVPHKLDVVGQRLGQFRALHNVGANGFVAIGLGIEALGVPLRLAFALGGLGKLVVMDEAPVGFHLAVRGDDDDCASTLVLGAPRIQLSAGTARSAR
jgi:hypothetical protein